MVCYGQGVNFLTEVVIVGFLAQCLGIVGPALGKVVEKVCFFFLPNFSTLFCASVLLILDV